MMKIDHGDMWPHVSIANLTGSFATRAQNMYVSVMKHNDPLKRKKHPFWGGRFLIAIQHSQGTPLGFGSEPFQNDIPTTPWARNADREGVEHHGIPPQKVNGVSLNRHPKIGYDLLASMRFTAIHGYTNNSENLESTSTAGTRTLLSGRTLQTHQIPCFHCHPQWTSTFWYRSSLEQAGKPVKFIYKWGIPPCWIIWGLRKKQTPRLVNLFEDAQDFLDHRLLIP